VEVPDGLVEDALLVADALELEAAAELAEADDELADALLADTLLEDTLLAEELLLAAEAEEARDETTEVTAAPADEMDATAALPPVSVNWSE